MEVNPLIFPGEEVDSFVIKEEIMHRKKRSSTHSNVLIISKKNILHQCQYYIKEHAQFHKYVYVRSRYGILKGVRRRYNQKGYLDFTYHIQNTFDTDMEAFLNYYRLNELSKVTPKFHWVAFKQEDNKLMLVEDYMLTAEKEGPLFQCEMVECKSRDFEALNFEIDFTNNLGVTFRVRCINLFCLVRWIKYKGKIYRAVLYHTRAFSIKVNNKFIGVNYATKSKRILHMTNIANKIAPHEYMEMKSVWMIDEQLGGLSVRQYRRLRSKIHHVLKKNMTPAAVLDIIEPSQLDYLNDKDYRVDPSVQLFLNEVLQNITEEEKTRLMEITIRNRQKFLDERDRNEAGESEDKTWNIL